MKVFEFLFLFISLLELNATALPQCGLILSLEPLVKLTTEREPRRFLKFLPPLDRLVLQTGSGQITIKYGGRAIYDTDGLHFKDPVILKNGALLTSDWPDAKGNVRKVLIDTDGNVVTRTIVKSGVRSFSDLAKKPLERVLLTDPLFGQKTQGLIPRRSDDQRVVLIDSQGRFSTHETPYSLIYGLKSLKSGLVVGIGKLWSDLAWDADGAQVVIFDPENHRVLSASEVLKISLSRKDPEISLSENEKFGEIITLGLEPVEGRSAASGAMAGFMVGGPLGALILAGVAYKPSETAVDLHYAIDSSGSIVLLTSNAEASL